MEVYRIAKASFSMDLTGLGARLNGGRWNRKGTGIIYTSESRALASLEFLVHMPLSLLPPDLMIISINIPSGLSIEHVSLTDLPTNWRSNPAPATLAEFGSTWAKSKRSLLLRVPSVIINAEFNILINPNHPEMREITKNKIEVYSIDSRLFGGKRS
jgi:RES domain-containing protein